jgi:ubiquinone biosynthesis protein COQ9|tara:strand:+ start:248440 stop:249057 length:618 start_codon:yes stop_codon:yes gene_type:complete
MKDQILEAALPDIVFDGWQDITIYRALDKIGHEKEVYKAAFPNGVASVIEHFSDWADRQMLRALESTNIEDMRVRDRIRRGVLTRLEVLEPHKEAVTGAMKYWSMPHRGLKAGKGLWHSADRIWLWAGDTSTDYNRYTKRGLLSAILASTTLTWLQDDSADHEKTNKHLDARIENIMQIGKVMGKFKGFKTPKCKKKQNDEQQAV